MVVFGSGSRQGLSVPWAPGWGHIPNAQEEKTPCISGGNSGNTPSEGANKERHTGGIEDNLEELHESGNIAGPDLTRTVGVR